VRFADLVVSPCGRWIVCVREQHAKGRAPENDLVAIPAAGGAPVVLHRGHDFYASPQFSPDGTKLVFLSWDHPNMPWDGTDAWLGAFSLEGALRDVQHVAGGPAISVFQPSFDPGGVLHVVSDETGFWNLYAVRDDRPIPLAPMNAEFGMPQWVFGLSMYAFLAGDRIACIRSERGREILGILEPGAGRVRDLPVPYSCYRGSLASDGEGTLAFVGSAPDRAASVVRYDVDAGRIVEVKRSFGASIDGVLSVPEPLTFATPSGFDAHALFYPPAHDRIKAPAGERPPLLVHCHGGPTSESTSDLSLGLQFWATRGIAVVDVNYSGSSGYGRAYRDRLRGQWGVLDAEDCVEAARALAARGAVDPRRLAIRGGSAGGYTTLRALVTSNTFSAGCSLYGIGDLVALASHTHKFEARYLDSLIGPFPERRDLYEARSPLRDLDRLSCPLLILQGADDRVVPPEQAEELVRALRTQGLPHAVLLFEGEGHGFRRAETIARALEAELYFYGRVFGFRPADRLPEIPIANL